MSRRPMLHAAAILALVLFAIPALAGVADIRGIGNFHQVNERLYRGAQPSDESYEDLARIGVQTVLDLRTPWEHAADEESLAVVRAGMRYVNVGIRGFRTPRSSELARARAVLDTGGVVFVHCAKGKDRTGTVVALARIERDGWSNERALAEANERGMHFWESGMRKLIRAHRFTAPAPLEAMATGPAPADSLGLESAGSH